MGSYFFSPPAAGAAGAGAAPGAGAPGAVGAVGAPGVACAPPALAAAAASRSFLSAIPWLLKMRVSANSPSLCPTRSEEHTSELQSRGHLVCRLLLEKKKKQY